MLDMEKLVGERVGDFAGEKALAEGDEVRDCRKVFGAR